MYTILSIHNDLFLLHMFLFVFCFCKTSNNDILSDVLSAHKIENIGNY